MDDEQMIFLWTQTFATLFSLSNKLQVDADRFLGELTSRQLMAMIAIFHLPQNQTSINAIARKLGTTKQNVKQLMTALRKKQYIILIPNETDKRAYNVEFTEAGKKALIKCNERGLHFFSQVFKGFSQKELESLWGYLQRLYRYDGEEQDGFEESPDLK